MEENQQINENKSPSPKEAISPVHTQIYRRSKEKGGRGDFSLYPSPLWPFISPFNASATQAKN